MQTSTASPLRQRFDQRRDEAISSFRKHLRADTLLAGLRRVTDQAVRETIKQHPLPEGAALVAVGGYGRGELYPYSDIDVLILLKDDPGADDKTRIEKLIAALWDLGLDLGHSVRSIADCRREAEQDITIETALMELRWVSGDKLLVQQLALAMRRQRDAQEFFQAKRAEMVHRHARHHDTPYALEPNCKEAPGGLRDLLTLRWIAQAAQVGNTWKKIADSGILTPAEYRALRRAELAFKRLRIELHLQAGRREDRVLFDYQPALAATYGFVATKNRRPSELLMQRYYWAARVASQLTTILMQAFEERLFPASDSARKVLDEDFCQVHNRLDIRRADEFERKPTLLLRAFLVMQRNPELTGLSAQIMRAMWHSRKRIDAQFRANPVNRHAFIQILQQPRGVVHALRRMTMLNILPRYLPEFRRIVGQMQHDLFHAYTVDQHTLMVIRNLRRFTMPEHAQEYPLASQLIANLDDHWLLYVAALYHDIAKGRGGDHSQLGAQDAQRFCLDHQISPENTELIEFLVREHLTMSRFAQKRDLTDPDVIHEFARTIGDERRLAALYLLTVADIRGTSPKVWNAWKGKLLEDLFRLTLAALGGTKPDRGTVLALRRDEAGAEVRRLGLRDESRDQFWQQLDVAYFLRHEASEIAWHTRQLYHRVNSAEPVVKARVVGQNEGLQIMVYAPDRNDLFVDICGYLDQRALSVQDARIHTTRHGWALDSFIVLLPDNDRDFRSWAGLVEHELAERLADPRCRGARTAPGYGRRRSRRARVFPIVPNIELQPDESGTSWRLSLIAADRPGLLHSLAQVFAHHGVSLNMAKILTLGDRVEDVFMVEGEVLGHPRSQLQFERSVLASLNETN